jgi:hypothetical protein
MPFPRLAVSNPVSSSAQVAALAITAWVSHGHRLGCHRRPGVVPMDFLEVVMPIKEVCSPVNEFKRQAPFASAKSLRGANPQHSHPSVNGPSAPNRTVPVDMPVTAFEQPDSYHPYGGRNVRRWPCPSCRYSHPEPIRDGPPPAPRARRRSSRHLVDPRWQAP